MNKERVPNIVQTRSEQVYQNVFAFSEHVRHVAPRRQEYLF